MKKTNSRTMEEKEYYLMYDVEATHWWYRALRDVIDYFIRTSNIRHPHILDAGCGTGITLKWLSSRGLKTAEGFDVSNDAISLCKKRGLMNVYEGSILDIKHSDNSFDIILTIDVLGLLDRKQAQDAINELYRVLRPGGLLIMQCAAYEWLRSPHDTVTSLSTRYTKQQIEGLFDKNKWQIKKVSYRIFFLFPLIVIIRLFKKIGGKNDHISKTDSNLPPKLFNTMLYCIQKIENVLFKFIDFPFGSSIFLVAEKKP